MLIEVELDPVLVDAALRAFHQDDDTAAPSQ
jgi:hypothetical protein